MMKMNDYPKYVEINDDKFKINTDFRVAIECNRIAQDDTIGDYERALAIIYKLFGKKGLEALHIHDKLLLMAKEYLSCGKKIDEDIDEKPDMDYIEDYSYIKTSFRSDYGINLDNENMHWWEFFDLMNGLSNSEFGNCCILNRIRNLRNYDTKDIKDSKERQKIEKAKQQVALKRYKPKRKEATEEQKKSAEEFFNALGL